MTFEPPTNGIELVRACESLRARLPAARFRSSSQCVHDLGDLAGDFEVFLFDAFGVLNVGERAIAGAVDRVTQLRRLGCKVGVVSNAASIRRELLWDKYRALGFDFSLEEIVSSRDALLEALAVRPQQRLGVMAPAGTDLSDLPGDMLRLNEDAMAFDRADGFILLAAQGWTDAMQDRLEQALTRCMRPVWVANPDLVAPREAAWSVEPGYFANRLQLRTGVVPRYFGKPYPSIFELARRRFALTCPDQAVLMIGDTLHTDILGGCAAGFRTGLIVSHGVSRDLALEETIQAVGIRPDFIVQTT